MADFVVQLMASLKNNALSTWHLTFFLFFFFLFLADLTFYLVVLNASFQPLVVLFIYDFSYVP
jgi:hypothetical protein